MVWYNNLVETKHARQSGLLFWVLHRVSGTNVSHVEGKVLQQ